MAKLLHSTYLLMINEYIMSIQKSGSLQIWKSWKQANKLWFNHTMGYQSAMKKIKAFLYKDKSQNIYIVFKNN